MDRIIRKPSAVEYEHEWEGGFGPLVTARAGYERVSKPLTELRDSGQSEANSDLGNTGRDLANSFGETF